MEAGHIDQGDRLLITGPTTGALYVTADDIRLDDRTVPQAVKGDRISLLVPEKVRASDKVYRIVKVKHDDDEI